MQLSTEDIKDVGQILARRFFTEQGWKFTDLKLSGNKIAQSLANVSDSYNKYPDMGKDWYVANSAEKNIHMTTSWNRLSELNNLLKAWPGQFDFLLKTSTNVSLCTVKSLGSDLNYEQQRAIADARKLRFNVYIFKTDIPDEMDFELAEVVGGISGVGNFKQEDLPLRSD
ncbi:MAG: hypothetical protein M8353_04065 [ANME-2 cluster archaeon]|nr:hypothetical protein [ANME-2 cluster archaeon]